LTPYRQNGRFCSVCGRARDEKSDAEILTEETDPNRSLQMAVTVARSMSAPDVARRPRAAPTLAPTQLVESTGPRPFTVSPGVIAGIAIVFFGLVWTGRRLNAPQKPTRPVVAPLPAVGPDDPAATRRAAREREAKAKRDLQDAERYSGDLRAQEAADRLQAELRNAQAPPPSGDPMPYEVIQLPPPVPSGASQTDSQGQAYPSVPR
jgi:hypothetical protein